MASCLTAMLRRWHLHFQAKVKLKSRANWWEMPTAGPMDDAWRQVCRTSAISERDQRGQASREKEQANVLAASDAQVSITSSCFSPPAFRESGSSSIVIHICVLQPLQEREEIIRGRRWKEAENQWPGYWAVLAAVSSQAAPYHWQQLGHRDGRGGMVHVYTISLETSRQ